MSEDANGARSASKADVEGSTPSTHANEQFFKITNDGVEVIYGFPTAETEEEKAREVELALDGWKRCLVTFKTKEK